MKPFNLEEYLKNPDRKVVTREGRSVRIICTDFNNINYPIIIEVEGLDTPLPVTREGRQISLSVEDRFDLFFASEKHEGWINVYRNKEHLWCGDIKRTKTEAKEFENSEFYITTIKIEWEE